MNDLPDNWQSVGEAALRVLRRVVDELTTPKQEPAE